MARVQPLTLIRKATNYEWTITRPKPEKRRKLDKSLRKRKLSRRLRKLPPEVNQLNKTPEVDKILKKPKHSSLVAQLIFIGNKWHYFSSQRESAFKHTKQQALMQQLRDLLNVPATASNKKVLDVAMHSIQSSADREAAMARQIAATQGHLNELMNYIERLKISLTAVLESLP